VWNLLAGCTDEIQVVDAGFGALVKRLTEEIQMEWLQNEDHWIEWTGKNLSASRRRVLVTHWYGQGYAQACHQYNFEKVFDRTGGNLTDDGSGDHLIKLQGLDEFNFVIADAQRDPLTGEMPADIDEELTPEEASLENDENAACSDGEEIEEISANDGSSSDEGGETTDEDEGEPFVCPPEFEVVPECPDESKRVAMALAHRFDVGWYTGEIRRKVTLSDSTEENGKYACKYPDSRKEFFHDLFREDYGVNKMWVVLKKI